MKTQNDDRRAPRAPAPRKPYMPPAIRREEYFESVAAGCNFNTKACTTPTNS